MAGEPIVAARRHETGRPQEKRDVERRLVREKPVSQLAMVAASLAMVGGHDEQRERPRRCHGVEKRSQRRVGECDLSEVGIVRKARPPGLRRIIGRMGIKDMDPQKAASTSVAGEPGDCRSDGLRRAGFRHLQFLGLVRLRIHLPIHGETAGEPEALVQSERGDESGRVEPGGAEESGRGRRPRAELVTAVVPHAVLVGIETGQDVGVRRQGHDVLGVCEREDPALGRESVEVRRGPPPVAVEAERVEPQRIDRDQHDVAGRSRMRRGSRRAGRTFSAARDPRGHRRQEEQERPAAGALVRMPPARSSGHPEPWPARNRTCRGRRHSSPAAR